ncbi:hypothetical protein CR513_24712, partial [Mucuna pruriens]
MQFQHHLNAMIQDLKMLVGQLAITVSQLQLVGFGNLPSQIIPNPKGNTSVVSLRSGRELPQQAAPNEATAGSTLVLPKKCRDLEIFSVPCIIGECTFVDAMLDLGASINAMPTSIYKSLNFGDLEPIGMTIQLANRSIVQPLGVLEDVLVQVNELIFPADFYVLDMKDETLGKGSTLIMG